MFTAIANSSEVALSNGDENGLAVGEYISQKLDLMSVDHNDSEDYSQAHSPDYSDEYYSPPEEAPESK